MMTCFLELKLPDWRLTSAKEIMFRPEFVCISVTNINKKEKWTCFNEILRKHCFGGFV